MEDSFAVEPVNTPVKKSFPWAGTIIFVIVLALVGAFAWKVLHYYNGIKNGTLSAETVFASSRPSTEAAIADLAAKAKGSGVLATDDDPMKGSATAALTIVEFGDFSCPYTKSESFVMHALVVKFPEKIRYIYRDFPLDELRPGATMAAYAGYCAQQQGKFWEFHDEIFARGDLTVEGLLAIANDIGLNIPQYQICLDDPATQTEVQADLADGYAAGVKGTPTFFINGEKIEGAIPFDIFLQIVQAFNP
jgi:protein-disulfide isomerase